MVPEIIDTVHVCMYVKLPPEATHPSSPDGRRDCELSTSPQGGFLSIYEYGFQVVHLKESAHP